MNDTDNRSDIELLERWCAGDNVAGNRLVERHFDALHRFFATKVRANNEDLIQETFLACTQAKHAFRGESSFRAYLFGLARIQLLRFFRKTYRQHGIDFTTASVRDLATSPSGNLAKSETLELLESAMQTIPLDQQIAIELTYVEGLTAPEVACALGIPENTVYSRLRRGKEHLRSAMDDLATPRTRA